jgi:glycosyltransferase involved in cell wall biosynthesis
MRVLHVYSGNLYGGIERLLVTLWGCQRYAPGLESEFAICFEGRLVDELRAAGATVHLLGAVRTSRPWTVLAARRRFADLLRRKQYDVAVYHSFWPHAMFAGVARAVGLPVVFWLHGQTTGKHWTERWAARTRPDSLISVSNTTAQTARLVFADVEPSVIYAPLSAPPTFTREDRAACRAELDTPDDAVVIIQVSRMEPCKGHDLHVEALGRLRDDPKWICWMVGGAQRPEELAIESAMKKRVVDLGIEHRVRFLGQRRDVARLLGAADIYCQPNRGPEGFSIAFVEACLANLPLVSTAMGGALEIVNERTGVLVPPDNVEALAATLRQLIEDDGIRRRLGDGAQHQIRSMCDPATQMRKLFDLLNAAAQRRMPAAAQAV